MWFLLVTLLVGGGPAIHWTEKHPTIEACQAASARVDEAVRLLFVEEGVSWKVKCVPAG